MLGIYGDSFADVGNIFNKNRPIGEFPWPVTLSKLLNVPAEYHARSTTSSWWSYEKFLSSYKKYNTIVFTYGQHNRWPSIDLSYGEGQLSHITRPDQLEQFSNNSEMLKIATVLVECKKITYSESHDIFVYQSIFNSVNSICRKNNIKLINFMPFEMPSWNPELYIDISDRHGPCITNASDVVSREVAYCSDELHMRLQKILNSGDPRHCHMNNTNNSVLAQMIVESMNDKELIVSLSADSRTSCDYKELEWMLQNEI